MENLELNREREMLDKDEIKELSLLFSMQSAENVLAWGMERFGSNVALVTSFQAEGLVLLDMAWKIDPEVRVITIDTGRLHEETYSFIQTVRNHYGINIEVHFPDSKEVREMVSSHGVNLFYQDVEYRRRCCDVRKVHPLEKALNNLEAWITGLRREQSFSRLNTEKIEVDERHGGLLKLNPLADWSFDEVGRYIDDHAIPQNPLYEKGYQSIGCAPCTRAVEVGEDSRAGRWWWEGGKRKECGMHCRI